MKMYKTPTMDKGTIVAIRAIEGESLEDKIKRILQNDEPIKDGAPEIFTERKEGVKPEYNPRTDTWDIALDAMDKVQGMKAAKRADMNVIKGGDSDEKGGEKDGGAESIQGTSNKQ